MSQRRLTFTGRHVYQITEPNFPDVPNTIPASVAGIPFSENGYLFKWTKEEFLRVFSSVTQGADTIYPEIAQQVSWLLWQFIEYPLPFTEGESLAEGITVFTGGGGGGNDLLECLAYYGIYDCETLERKLNMLRIDYSHGEPLLVDDCCGNNDRYFRLGEVALDSNGLPLLSGDYVTGIDDAFDGFDVSTGNANCYAQSATAYLLDRAYEWAALVIDFSQQALDTLSGGIDERINIAKLTGEILLGTGDLPEIQDLAKTAVQTALNSAAVVAPLEAAWNYSGKVSKTDLREWIQSAPNFENAIPVRELLREWLNTSLILGLNNDLSSLAKECESGNSIPALPPGTAPLLGSSAGYDVFTVLDSTEAATRTIPESEFLLNGIDTATVQAIMWTRVFNNDGNWQVTVRVETLDDSAEYNHFATQQNMTAGEEYGVVWETDEGARTAIKNVVNAFSVLDQFATASTGGMKPNASDFVGQGGTCRLRCYVAVNTAL